LVYNDSKIQHKSSIIYPGINLAEVESMKSPKVQKRETPNEVTFVGRLFYPKGITYALQAFNVLVNEMGEKNYKLNIVGDGPLKSLVKRYINDMQLTDYVNVKGQIPRSAVIKTLEKSSSIILPSIYEGCPFVLMEANALGVPMITFDFDWAKEFVTNGVNGYRSIPFDVNSLAKNILKATDLDPSMIMDAAQKFDIKNTAKKTIQAYEKLLS
jgi:glycosyltransferase involved in cell wall biosynthesis